jgi:hypothetical protein
MTKNYLVGYYLVNGVPDSVETPIIGNPRAEKAKLTELIHDKHPNARTGTILPNGQVIDSRSATDPGFITLYDGQTIRQLFKGVEGEDLGSRRIGTVFFSGSPFEIELVFSAGVVKVRLLPKLRTDSIVQFSNQLDAQRQVSEIPKIITEVLEPRNIRNLVFKFRNA